MAESEGSKENRNRDYEVIQKLAEEVKTENGSIIWAEVLKGVKITSGTTAEERDDGYYKRRPCPQICRVAAEIAARNLL